MTDNPTNLNNNFNLAFVFPGQGSQKVAMGQEFIQAFPQQTTPLLQQADDALDFNLSKLMHTGDENTLKLTANAQPAIYTLSMVFLYTLIQQQVISPQLLHNTIQAGHSVGEYSALTAAKYLDFHDTVKLTHIRGKYMQQHAPTDNGAMCAIIGMSPDDVYNIVDDYNSPQHLCEVANDNSSKQIVISGHKLAVQQAAAQCTSQGARRTVFLPVSAPFHCSLMKNAASQLQNYLLQLTLLQSSIHFIPNFKPQLLNDNTSIKSLLVQQVYSTVKWRQSILLMEKLGVKTIVEFSTSVLSPLVKQTSPNITTLPITSPHDVDKLHNLLDNIS